ncbi:hypothetical protein [Aureimonas ureilytica]|uniref:hypothetical protein n=1 Tax=Aureimonas ureilytica TaxID=401562 RepID=UPI00036626C7|nr:hypothetical protein [Aureimonas ureilytica]
MNRVGSATAGLVLAGLSISSAPIRADDGSIGSAHEEADGTLVLRLRAEAEDGSALGEGELRYAPEDPDYRRVHRHLGSIPRGSEVPVRPFPKKWTKEPAILPPFERPPR